MRLVYAHELVLRLGQARERVRRSNIRTTERSLAEQLLTVCLLTVSSVTVSSVTVFARSVFARSVPTRVRWILAVVHVLCAVEPGARLRRSRGGSCARSRGARGGSCALSSPERSGSCSCARSRFNHSALTRVLNLRTLARARHSRAHRSASPPFIQAAQRVFAVDPRSAARVCR